jgi:hypothetical protein
MKRLHGETNVDQKVAAAAGDEKCCGWWKDDSHLCCSLRKQERTETRVCKTYNDEANV